VTAREGDLIGDAWDLDRIHLLDGFGAEHVISAPDDLDRDITADSA